MIRIYSLAFFIGSLMLGVVSVLSAEKLWLFSAALAVLLLGALCYVRAYTKQLIVPVFVLSGLAYAGGVAERIQANYWPAAWEGQDIQVQGRVTGLPEVAEGRLRMQFRVDSAQPVDTALPTAQRAGLLRLSWYGEWPETLVAGSRWQLQVRVKRPRGFMNPGGFDYEKWLFTQRVMGTGYVRSKGVNQLLAPDWRGSTDRLRQHILSAMQQHGPAVNTAALLPALAVAYRGGISDAQWDTLRSTGTSHLLAISGLHISLVAGFGFVPVFLLWWVWPRLYLWVPAALAGAVAGALLASSYALLAGFTLPTQRALVMVLVLMFGWVLRRRIPFTYTLALALLAVLLIDPLAPWTVGFWLSFAAVLMLFLLNQRRLQWGWGRVLVLQLGLSLGMLPLTAIGFGSVSLASPLANLLAIPLVSLIVVPLVLLGVLALLVSSTLAAYCWLAAGWVLEGLFIALDWLAGWEWSLLVLPEVPPGWLLVGLAGFFVWLLPKGMPGRWLGLLLLVPMFTWQPPRPEPGAFQLSVLDVGQGLASVVRTANHVLVFDAGPKSGGGFDTGELVVLPWLQAQGIKTLDTLLISHADRDHSGGAEALLTALPVKRVLTGEAGFPEGYQSDICTAGQRWQWDGVDFALLHFSAQYQHPKRNNRSCVLRVSNAHHSALLSADIERSAEYWLVKQQGDALASRVLIVPHHGSRSSSSPPFLKQVNPELAVVTTGYRNHFNHPHPEVVKRYRDWGIPLLNTADSGAVRIDFPWDERPFMVYEYRREQRNFWVQ